MISDQEYTYQDPLNLNPIIQPIKYEEVQPQYYQGEEVNLSAPETFQTNSYNFNEYEVTNTYDQVNDINNYVQDNNTLNQAFTFGEGNEINYEDITNKVDIIDNNNQYNISNINEIDYGNQVYSYNEYNNANIENYTEQENIYTPVDANNQVSSYYTDNSNNIQYQYNEINAEYPTNLENQVDPNIIINQTNEEVIQNNPSFSVHFSQANDMSGVNQINEVYTNDSSNMNVLTSIKTVNSIKHKSNLFENSIINENKENEQIEQPTKIDSPRLINPLTSPIPPSPKLISKQENEENKISSTILTPDEKILLKNEKDTFSKDFNIKSHYELTLTKEPFGFNYNKLHKIGYFLLSHFEMPQNYEYRSPLLSQNSKYLACIAHGPEDFVYVWEVCDLYWYRYKFSSSRVDGISFTPDSSAIIIVYRYSSPIMYNLSTGKKILEFEKNGEENNREGFQCTFTLEGKHFAYTTDKSFTLWSLRTGNIKQQIMDDSPIKIICNEYLICIAEDLNVVIKKISSQEDIISFQIKGVQSPFEILDARCTNDMKSFIYVIKQGIIIYNFFDREYKGIQKFLCGVDKAKISDDCRYVLKTNLKNISIYDIEKNKSICTILKDKFKEFRIDFNNKKLVVIDDISIHIHNYGDEGSPQQYVWLEKNPTKFEDVKFSRDSKILLARVDRNNAIAYDLKTGYIVKKWQNIDENWLDYAMTRYGGDKIATKSHSLLVNVWNFSSRREEANFYGYDSYSFCFSGGGQYLACGAKVGHEVARIWDINNQKYGIFNYNGKNNNFHTVAHLTLPEPDRLICCSIDQNPIVFNTNTRELLYVCQCPFRFEEIYTIQSDIIYDVFLVKGKDESKRNVGILYKLSDGSLLETYENYSVLELARNTGVILSKCQNINGGKLTSTNIKNLGEPQLSDFQIQTEKCKLLDDNKCAVIEYGDEFNKEFNIINVENGTFIGKINFVKKNERKSATYLTIDPIEKEMYFRYFEFLSPQETMVYKKKNIFNVDED